MVELVGHDVFIGINLVDDMHVVMVEVVITAIEFAMIGEELVFWLIHCNQS